MVTIDVTDDALAARREAVRAPRRAPTPPRATARRERLDGPTMAGHIEGLDGLRALAVVLVVIFHLWPATVPGGFIGVDFFFVISGFLITTLLLRERSRKGHIDLVAFWTRRARRLLPALVVVVLTSIAAARIVSADLLVDIRRQVIGAFTFTTNWVEIGAGSDYFDQTGHHLLEPLWSLAVEEQFYVFWPIGFAVLATFVRSVRARAVISLAIAAMSAVAMAVLFDPASPTRVYYGTDTHVFGLMIGVALAYAFVDGRSILSAPVWQHLRRWVGFIAIAAVVGLSTVIDGAEAWTYRGGMVIASLAAVVAVAALPGERSSYVSVLEAAPLRWIGQRSYGLYLWHWPVLLIVVELAPPVVPGEPMPVTTALVVVVVTGLLTEASYRLVETPVRVHGFRGCAGAVAVALDPGAGRRDGGPRLALVGTVATLAVVAVAGVGVATAPKVTSAQAQVEAGLAAIEQQQAAAGVSAPAGAAGAAVATETGWNPGRGMAGRAAAAEAARTASATGPTWDGSLAEPPGTVMTALGDSVMSGAAPAMYERFPGILVQASPNLQWKDAPAMVRQGIDDGSLRRVVVLNFGTNAGLEDEAQRTAMAETLDLLGPDRRVVLVGIVGISYWVPDANAQLRAAADQRDNVAYAAWDQVVAGAPGLLHDDRTHPNMDGIAAYADLVATIASELGPGG